MIPTNIRDKYSELIERSLTRLIKQGSYKRLKTPQEKAKAIQKVINYYWNHMKSVVLKEKVDLLTINEVYQRALK